MWDERRLCEASGKGVGRGRGKMYCAYVEQKKAVDCKVLRIYVHGREKGGGGECMGHQQRQ